MSELDVWGPVPRLKIAADATFVLFVLTFVVCFGATFFPVDPARLALPENSALALCLILIGIFPRCFGRPSALRTDGDGIAISGTSGDAHAAWNEIERAHMFRSYASLTTRDRTVIPLNLTGYSWGCGRRLRDAVAKRAGLTLVFSVPGFYWLYRKIERRV